MVLSRKQKISFYKNRKRVREVVLKNVKKKKHIIFGARSLNAHFPTFLDKRTADYDILIEKGDPKKVARRLERKLDRKFGANVFVVEPALHPGTFKVKSVLGKEGIIDISKAEKKIMTDKIKGIRYSSLEFERRKIKQSLADPQSKFRHDKDRERLERIKIFESLRKKRKVKVRRKNIPTVPKAVRTLPISFKLNTRTNL